MAELQFIFSEETSSLSDREFEAACEWLDKIGAVIQWREQEAERNSEWAQVMNPDGGWHPDHPASLEQDQSIKNAYTSYRLLAEQDRDVVRKLRLYCQMFTGYQLATLARSGGRPWIAEKLPDDWDVSLRLLAGPPDGIINYTISVAYALPEELRVSPPRKFGEIGWLFRGAILNHDAYDYQSVLSLMYENGLIEILNDRLAKNGCLKIVEIGGGYGALAYYLTRIFDGKVRYAIIDIPESLAFSSVYYSTVLPEMDAEMICDDTGFGLPRMPGVTFVPNIFYKHNNADDGPVDLCINTLSLAEMTVVQVEDYCASVAGFIGDSGLFFEQNHQENDVGLAKIFPRYFKNLRKCTTNLVPTYPTIRGQANVWVNLGWSG